MKPPYPLQHITAIAQINWIGHGTTVFALNSIIDNARKPNKTNENNGIASPELKSTHYGFVIIAIATATAKSRTFSAPLEYIEYDVWYEQTL